MRNSVHAQCLATKASDVGWLVCHRSRGHSVLYCKDTDKDRAFLAPGRVGFPKLQPLGVRKLRPVAAQLAEALANLRRMTDPEVWTVDVHDIGAVRRYLVDNVEGALAEALGAIDPRFRAEDRNKERED